MKKLAVFGGEAVRKTPFPGWPICDQNEEQAVVDVVRSGRWGRLTGEQVTRFEKRFAEYQQAKYAIAMVNGSVALRLALLATGLKAGDEVIVPPYTFIATVLSVIEANGTPVFVDIDENTWNMDPAKIEAAITPRTRVIIPVHLGGLPVEMDSIMAIANRHNLIVIEDACHAHGSEYKGRRVGAIGHMGCFSFQSSKNLTSGEGGAVLTNDERLAELVWSHHNCGRNPQGAWYEHHRIASNYRLSEFHGAILNCQLDRLDEQTRLRNQNGIFLSTELAKIPGLSPQARPEGTRHAQHIFCFRYDPSVYGVPRSEFLKALQAEGLSASAGYPLPVYRQPIFLNHEFGPYAESAKAVDYSTVSCPVCERICELEGCWLTHNMLLGTQKDMEEIIDAFRKIYECRDELM